MQFTILQTLTARVAKTTIMPRSGAITLSRPAILRLIALMGVVALAAGLRFVDLQSLGYANHYYSAAVTSMLQSWHNFFFVAAEPGGAVSVDKPPVGLWVQAISAYLFGINGFALLLPEIVAGILSVMVLYHLVRRSFGTVAGLLAALALAITPIVVATDRNNTIDSILILTLLLSAWAFIKATESRKMRYLLLGTGLVGVAFNIKMLEAFLPLPAFYALYFLGAGEGLLRKVGKLAVASVLLVIVSLSWATVVDLTPADQRPYIGSSGDNTVTSLITGYNGTQRLFGMRGNGSLISLFGGGGTQSNNPGPGNGNRQGNGQNNSQPSSPGNDGGGTAPGAGNNSSDGGRQQPSGVPGGGPGGNGGNSSNNSATGAGFGGGNSSSNIGQAGPLRLFTTPLSKEVSWLLPFGLVGVVLLAFGAHPRWPIALRHQTLILWGGWLATGAVFFSVAGFYHEYYLSIIGPAIAALVGIGAIELWKVGTRRWWLGGLLLTVAMVGTLALQFTTAQAFANQVWWTPIVVALAGIGMVAFVVGGIRNYRVASIAGFAAIMIALMITPGIWSGMTALNASQNQSLPSAYGERSSGPVNQGAPQVNEALLEYLQATTQDTKYLMAVPSSMQGSDYVLATGRPVLYLGGFMGQDNVLTGEQLAKLVADGELRYIYWNSSSNGGSGGRGGSGGQSSDVSTFVSNECQVVQGFDTLTQNTGNPDGTGSAQDGVSSNQGNMQVSLYQCGASPK